MSIQATWAPPEWLRRLEGGADEVLWNLRGLEQGWRDYPEAMDFLSTSSPNYAWKDLQTRIYLDALQQELPVTAPAPLRVLDAACGIGRMLLPLARGGHTLRGIDACKTSLEAAQRHLSEAAGEQPEIAERVSLTWDDIDSCELEAGAWDRVLALELLCYLPDPAHTAARLAAALRPGGLLVLSVEAWPGALLSWPQRHSPGELARLCVERRLALPDDLWVHPMEAAELTAILQGAGLDMLRLEPVHFLADGPLTDHVDLDRLGQPAYDRELVELERSLRSDPALEGLSRAWLAVARKKDL